MLDSSSAPASAPNRAQTGPPASGSQRDRGREEDGSDHDRAADSDAPGHRGSEQRAEQATDGADPEGEPDQSGPELQGAAGVQHEQGTGHEREEVDRRRTTEAGPEHRMVKHEPQSLLARCSTDIVS